jgi:hypothetical protein
MSNPFPAYTLTGTEYVTGADLLLRWMGTYWTAFSEDPEFVRKYQAARNLMAAQFTVWYQETAALLDRQNIPVYHRERWWPAVLSEATQNTGTAAKVQLGGRFVGRIGPQTDPEFIAGQAIPIGGYYPLEGVTTYPLPNTVSDVASVIVNDLTAPTVVLVRGVDYYVENGTLFFLHDTDPLQDTRFARTATADGLQTVVWLCDALLDRNYVQNFAGYVLNLMDLSSEFYKRYLNALWDVYNKGATLTEFTAGIAAMLDEPSVLAESETVEQIVTTATGTQVITDQHVYAVSADATLRTTVRKGAILARGEVLTQTIRVYDNIDPSRLAANTEYGTQFRTDVPALFLPPAFFRAELQHGLGLSWLNEPVTSVGLDANGNPKLRFNMQGTTEDVELFWTDFWNYCETQNVSSVDMFGDALRYSGGNYGYYGSVQPMAFFLANFLKANLLVVTIASDQLTDQGRRGMRNLALLQTVIPEHVYVCVMERQTVGPDEYEEYEDAALVLDTVTASEQVGSAHSPASRLGYGDRTVVRWIPTCGS